jgi:hypothetical protein
MSEYSKHVLLHVQQIEDFYPEFIQKTAMEDSLMARAMFYELMVASTEMSPDFPWKDEVLEVLRNRQAFAHDGLRAQMRIDPR